jgi:hypothetical protein
LGTGAKLPAASNRSPNRRFTSVWCRRTNSRNGPSAWKTVAEARVWASSTHVAPGGSMMSAPMAPLFECLMGSDDWRLVAPNSMGAERPKPSSRTVMSPAYHW